MTRRVWARPELGSVAGVLFVFLFFRWRAEPEMFTLGGIVSILEPTAQLGILAIAAALLMISGEFDLSVGSAIAVGGIAVGLPLTAWGWPLEAALGFTAAVALLIGLANGALVVQTRLPSFIVTLAALFILRGLSLVTLKWTTGGATQLRGIRSAVPDGHWLLDLLSGTASEGLFRSLADRGWIDSFKTGLPKVQGIPVEILWFLLLVVMATWVLRATPFGNWILAVGGSENAARSLGVPVKRVKITLFCLTALAGSFVGAMNALDFGSTDAARGTQKEFEAIIAAVIGGCLLTGGYGSVIGAALGALIFGTVSIGISYTDIDQDMFKIFLGGMLLLAVLLNHRISRRFFGAV